MATNNRGGSRGATRRRSGQNNNPEGRNQYSRSPLATAATFGGAIAAGLFLWSRRDQISAQLASLGDQLGDWRDGMGSSGELANNTGRSERAIADAPAASEGRTQAEIAEEALTLKELGNPA